MASRARILRDIMLETGTSQSGLARVSGVHQPSISQMLAGKIDLSDEQLDRLLSCMGHRLEVERSAVRPRLTRAERRSWRLHRELALLLDQSTFASWRPRLLSNIDRTRAGVRGQVHLRNLQTWQDLVERDDLPGLRRALTGLDRKSIEMREVTPFSGLLPDERRQAALRDVG